MWSFLFFFTGEKDQEGCGHRKGKFNERRRLFDSRGTLYYYPPPPQRIFPKTGDEKKNPFPSLPFFFFILTSNVSLSFLANHSISIVFFLFFFKSINLRMIRHLRAYLAKLLNAADCGFMQSGTRDVFSCSAINLCISSETDNVVTLGEYRRTVWVPRRWWRRRRRGRGGGGAHEGRALVGDGESFLRTS